MTLLRAEIRRRAPVGVLAQPKRFVDFALGFTTDCRILLKTSQNKPAQIPVLDDRLKFFLDKLLGNLELCLLQPVRRIE